MIREFIKDAVGLACLCGALYGGAIILFGMGFK